MNLPTPAELRAMVQDVIREVTAEMAAKSAPAPPRPRPADTGPAHTAPAPRPARVEPDAPAKPTTVAQQFGVDPSGPRAAAARRRAETVRLRSDSELDGFVRKLLELFENPKNRQDLRAGRLTFTLAPDATRHARHAGAQRIDEGLVNERQIEKIADFGSRLILGRKAVITPLAREKARALGVQIEKER